MNRTKRSSHRLLGLPPRPSHGRRLLALLCAGMACGLFSVGCQEAAEPPPPLVLITLEGNGSPPAEASAVLEQYGFGTSWGAVASSSNVVAALGALHTGLRPWQHGAVDDATALHPGCETLALTLKALGYETSAYTDRSARLERLGFGRGYARFGALRSGKRALSELDSLAPGRFVWLHLRFDAQRGAARQWRRLGGVLEAAAKSAHWDATAVAIVGVTGPQAVGLDRRALEVPIHLRSPGVTLTTGESAVAASRIYETLNSLAGGEPLPATAASLLETDARVPLFSSLYGRRLKAPGEQGDDARVNEFSLVEGERQLVWRAATSTAPRVLPLSGNGRPQLQLRRWAEPAAELDEPQVREAMAARLRRAWLADLDGEEPMRWRPLESGGP